jgi:radical SAM superfamily enzyme YgiQ (UPF0313 family)
MEILLDKIRELEPDLIGFTLLSMHVPTTERVTRRVKSEFPAIPIIWGGIHVIACPEECIRHADIICTGEGEHCLPELADDPRRTDIKGFWFKDKDGHIIKNEPLPLNTNLDELPFASYKVNEWQIERDAISDILMTHEIFIRDHYRIGSARNCPYRCSYCHHSTFRDIYKGQKYLRRRSVDSVIAELKQRKEDLKLRFVEFIDDVFTMDRRWIREFAEKYKSEVGLPFYAACHPRATSRRMLELLRDAGCTQAGFGLQSGSPKMVRQIYQRGTTNEQNVALVRDIVDVGIEVIRLDVLTNTKYEDEEDCRATLRFLCDMPKPYTLILYKLVEFPTSKLLYMKDLPRGTQTPEGFFHYNMLYLMTQSRQLSSETILALADDRYLRNHPQALADLCSAVITPDETMDAPQERIKILTWQLESTTLKSLAKLRIKDAIPESIKKVLRPVKKALRG